MNCEAIKQRFSQRIRENYEDYLKEWLSQEPEELISSAEEISATKMLLNMLSQTASGEDMEYLLRFENPLEVVRDGWLAYSNTDMSNELHHVLWLIGNDPSIWEGYKMVEDAPASKEKVLTVREFISQHPDTVINIMAPGGYVFLTSEWAKLLLSGQSVQGNPGHPEYAMEITAEELLNQEVLEANFSDGTWNLLSGHIRKQEQGQSPVEQGVTMC
ncbi:DUF3848 domain-containing protein [Erysipelothrix anatis]|uniref:DUF3848 domain-containing protein n=1 Tax=Erysipelothrix anatis TaxID=2683713 RepID=UPI00140E365C|nr:DUF3848 domain-containing protein [Erysipelothrix anatis]